MFAYEFAKAINRPGIPQGFVTMSAGSGGKSPEMASPLAWTSYAGVKDATRPSFRVRLEALFLQDPASEVSKQAIAKFIAAVKASASEVAALGAKGGDMTQALLRYPPFPEAGQNKDVPTDTVPTLTYNWCVSPLTPMAVAGVVWMPGEANIGYAPADYAAELELYAKSLPATYGQKQVQFLYAQPAAALAKDLTAPSIPGAKSVTFEKWPKSLKEIAGELGKLAASK
jgi:hypothetical protein